MIDLSNCCRHCGCIDPTDGIVTDLRARVTELEGAVEAARVDAIRKAVEALPRSPLFDNLDMVNIDGWHIQRPDLLAALLPAPAPGRDTAGPGTTTGGTDAA